MNKPIVVITDGYTLNPGDLSWEGFKEFGEIHYYDRTAREEMKNRCSDATVIVTNKTPVPADVIQSAPRLKVIAVTATGYNIVDIEAARKLNIPVCNVPEYGTYSVAQHAMSLILELTNHVGLNSQSVAAGGWSSCPDFSFSKKPIIELQGKTLGIIGMGRIGQCLANMGKAFGMNVIYHSRVPKQGWGKMASLEEVFRRSDFVSIHCPQTRDNTGFINESVLSQMKSTAYLVNTSRGALINEHDLATALRKNQIAGAALDVLSIEPPPSPHPLIGLENCIVTPHNAWLSKEARVRIMNTTFENVRLAIRGKPQHVVN